MHPTRKLIPVNYSPCPCCNNPPQRRRKRKFRTPRRIKRLARPKYLTPKYTPSICGKCVTPFKKSIRRDPTPVSTRIDQLAVPKVRKLVAARDEYMKLDNPWIIYNLDKKINKSLFTVYSRLANVVVPLKREKPKKWSDTERDAHQKWLDINAKNKWPFDFKLPDAFYDPITKLPSRKALLKRKTLPHIKKYEKQLKKMAEEAYEEKRVDREPKRYNAKEWKEHRDFLKKRPIRRYIKEYGETIRQEAANVKAEREERKAEVQFYEEKWDIKSRAEDIEKDYKTRPTWVKKLTEPPGWIKTGTDKETAEIKQLEERKKFTGDRSKLKKFGGRPRSLKLAIATQEQKEEINQQLEKQKKEIKAIEQGFVIKDPKMKTLPPAHKLYKSVQKLSEPRQKREKFVFPENYTRFKNYW